MSPTSSRPAHPPNGGRLRTERQNERPVTRGNERTVAPGMERGNERGRPRDGERRVERRDASRGRLTARMTTVLRDALPLVILAIAMVGAPVLIFEPHGLPRLRGLERDLEQVEAENRAMERDIGRLRVQVKMLKDDLTAVEKVARTELGLVRKSEIVFQLPKPAN